MTEKVIKRGYVKWTDEDGVFHKEPLADHPELLAKASPKEQLAAEEARRLNAAADVEEPVEDEIEETLEELKKAPEDVLTASGLSSDENSLPSDEPLVDNHKAALKELAEKTAE